MSPPIQTNLFINGEYVPSSTGETLSIYSPVDDSLVSDSVQVASEADVDRAVAAARAAFPGWRDTAGHKRAKCMLKFAELLERESERLAGLGRFLFIFYSPFCFFRVEKDTNTFLSLCLTILDGYCIGVIEP
jgi:hypothetical protein